jgi:2',3'-cyclic-nucleotide 2'-phosphodiesterase (5'-nucleotidase family)
MHRIVLAFCSGVLLLTNISCHKTFYGHGSKSQFYKIEQGDPQDSAMTAMLSSYKAGVDTQMQVVVGRTDIPLSKAQPECTLGNFIVDALFNKAKETDGGVEAAVFNYGGIRLPYIAPGIITLGKMYELMPFDDVIVIAEVPGDVMKEFCDHMAKWKGWPVSGMRFRIENGKAVDIEIGGRPLNEQLVYKIAINEYISKGGDNCIFMVKLKKRSTVSVLREAMVEYVARLEQAGLPLHPTLEKRVWYAE